MEPKDKRAWKMILIISIIALIGSLMMLISVLLGH